MAQGARQLTGGGPLGGWIDAATARLEAERGWNQATWRPGPYDLTMFVHHASPWGPPLRSLLPASGAGAHVSMTVHATTVEHLASLVDPPDPAWAQPGRSLRQSIQASRHRLVWDGHHGLITAMSLDGRSGFVAAAGELPEWESSQPFRMHIHWLSTSLGHAMVHAGCVGDERGAVLLLGNSGAGKSTTTLAGVAAGMATCGDDYTHVAPDEDGTHVARPIYGVVKTRLDAAVRADALLEGAPRRTTVSNLTAIHELHAARSSAFATEMAVRAIAVVSLPRSGQPPGHAPTSPIAAVMAAAPSTIAQTPYEHDASMRFITRLAQNVPCYEVRPPRDLPATAALIDALLDEVTRATHGARA
ncbi:MAG: hypothetical protein RIE08_15830 [Acidimicrobiales bacterium]